MDQVWFLGSQQFTVDSEGNTDTKIGPICGCGTFYLQKSLIER